MVYGGLNAHDVLVYAVHIWSWIELFEDLGRIVVIGLSSDGWICNR